jgi:1,4-alpha-glucan branching enzyme
MSHGRVAGGCNVEPSGSARSIHVPASASLEEPVVIKQIQAKGTSDVKVQFILPNGSIPGKVSVVGDFNGWDPAVHPLRKRSNGTRSVSVSLPAGRRYAFRYLGEDGQWLDDEHAHAFEPNGVGGVNGIIST